jgi:hypothetical protein
VFRGKDFGSVRLLELHLRVNCCLIQGYSYYISKKQHANSIQEMKLLWAIYCKRDPRSAILLGEVRV